MDAEGAEGVVEKLGVKYPRAILVLTLGSRGSCYFPDQLRPHARRGQRIQQDAAVRPHTARMKNQYGAAMVSCV